MCGIAGFAGAGEPRDLARMSAAIEHRGPDGAAQFVDPALRVFFAHRRLAVIDIAGGAQPMWDAAGDIGVVTNGEIYNHAELRRELQGLGHRFRTDHSDTEVLVHGYRAWGDKLPERLNGMFAFVILDRPNRCLFAARDRFGKKPLYYHSGAGGFIFASELRAVLRHSSAPRELDERSVQKFFGYGYVPAPLTLYRGIAKLPGGYRLHYRLDDASLKVEPYWRFAVEPRETGRSDESLCEELRALLAQAVRRRLVADVPLGVFLSGGIDSSAVLAFAAQAAGDRVKTFAIGFNEASFDETPYARMAARSFATDHGERRLDFSMARKQLPTLLGRVDEPTGDASLLPTHLLSAFARESVTVALGGDGGDELFAGYDPFRALAYARLARHLPAAWIGAARYASARLPVSHRYMSLGFRLQRALRGLASPQALWHPVWLAPAGPEEMRRLFERPLPPEELYAEAVQAWQQSEGKSIVDRSLEFYARLYLQDDILAKVDRASMLVALEVRAPFLDNDLVDFVRCLPQRYKLRRGRTKYLLRRALRGVLPPEILRRRKQGFAIPAGAWLREWPAEDQRLEAPGLRQAALDRLWHEHRAGLADHRQLLWCSLALRYHLCAA